MIDSGRKGKQAERDVANWLNRNGFPHAERRGPGFTGPDIIGIPGLVLEVKDTDRLKLAEFIDQLEEQLDATGWDMGAVIHKRRGKGNVADWYATMPAYLLARLLHEAGYGDFA